jgi:hypothetical protein
MARKAAAPGQPDVAQVLARMKAGRARGRGRHSPLYRWFRTNHARLLEAFAIDAPSWASLAAALGESGLTDGDNKPPTAEGARTTWYRVRRDLAAKQQAQGTKPAALVPSETTPRTATASVPEQEGNKEGGDPPRRFRPVKLRGVTGTSKQGPPPPSPKPATPISTNPEPGVDVDDLLSRFMPGAAPRD